MKDGTAKPLIGASLELASADAIGAVDGIAIVTQANVVACSAVAHTDSAMLLQPVKE